MSAVTTAAAAAAAEDVRVAAVAAEEELRKEEKPQADEAACRALAADHYAFGAAVEKCRQLESYDDVNFYMRAAGGGEYIFKIHNGVESDNPEFLEGMQALLLHMRAHGIVAPYPVDSTAGEWFV